MKIKRAAVLSFILMAMAALACLLLAATLASPVYGTSPAHRSPRSEGRIVSGLLTSDDTWGPNSVVTITADVLIPPATTVVIGPGTTILIAPTDGANLGTDPNRIEYLVQGTLQVNGPVTFTSSSPTPACADWVGIYFQAGSNGYLDRALVEYGVHAVELNTLNPINITNSALRFNCHIPTSGNAWGAGMAIYAGTHQVVNTDIYGNIVQTSGAWAEGGGVQMVPGAGPSLFQNCTLYDNTAENLNPSGDAAGGGMNILAADPIIDHCTIYNNQVMAGARAFGGGICLDNSNAVIKANTSIYLNDASAQNQSAYGGGISIGQAMTPAPIVPVILDSHVLSNSVASWSSYGGGIGFYDASWTMAIISDTEIAFNYNAGAMAAGGGIGMAGSASANRFEDNLIHDNVVMANGGGGGGGGICLFSNNSVNVTNNLIANNVADDPPGTWSGGGGIYADGAASSLINNTVVSNTAVTGGQGGGVYLRNGLLLNTIIASNTAGIDGGGLYWFGGTADFDDLWNNLPNDYDSTSVPPANDISVDPRFVGSGSLAAFYHLRANSLCIDAGTGPGPGIPTDDYDDEARPLYAGWDIGFDEVYAPLFTINKQASGSLVAGTPLTYTLTVLNSGPGAASGVLITDALPAGASYLGGGSYAAGVVNWTVARIPANGGLAQVTFVVSTCQVSLLNQSYRVVTSAQGVASGWGSPLTTNLLAPMINANFNHWPPQVQLNEPVNFVDTSTTDGSPLVAWSWDLGDGTGASGPSVVHSYTMTGNYTVTLAITDSCGFTAQLVETNAVQVTETGATLHFYLPIVVKNY